MKIIKTICFLLLFTGLYALSMEVFRWKDFHYKKYPNSATVSGFYKMKKNTIDIIFLGSSHGVHAFDPQVLYDKYGLCSYNLSTEQQSLVISYFLLEEALKYQKPSAIILDSLMCFKHKEYPMNSKETCIRKVIDQMKFSQLKVRAINEICNIDPTLMKSSFYMLNLRYHERWKSLSKTDFYFKQLNKPFLMKGFSPIDFPWKNKTYSPLKTPNKQKSAIMQINMELYLNKIVDLCKEKEIPLLLVKTPYLKWDYAKHKCMQSFADKKMLNFYDFNTEELYALSNYDYSKDGYHHIGNSGAYKVSSTLGEILVSDYHVPAHFDEQWEESREFAQSIYKKIEQNHLK